MSYAQSDCHSQYKLGMCLTNGLTQILSGTVLQTTCEPQLTMLLVSVVITAEGKTGTDRCMFGEVMCKFNSINLR